MSRKYLNNKWCARCNRKEPTPYLKKNTKLLPKSGRVLDIGCGNGRNSEYMKSLGYTVDSIDMVDDYGFKLVLGKDKLPRRYKYDIILANYVLMFLDFDEHQQVLDEILRAAKVKSAIVIEMYPAKDAYAYHMPWIVNHFEEDGFEVVRQSKDRCVLRRT